MNETGFIRNELIDPEFYLKSASLFLRGSFGMEDRITAMAGLISNIAEAGEDVFKYLDIWHVDEITGIPDYFKYSGCDAEGNSDYWLELIGSLLGVQRQWQVTYVEDTEQITDIITLNNYEYLVLIQATIQKNHIVGSRSDLRRIYRGTEIDYVNMYSSIDSKDINYFTIKKSYIEGLKFKYLSMPKIVCRVIMQANKVGYDYGNITDKIKWLFQSGELTVKNLGITYEYYLNDDFQIGTFEPSGNVKATTFFQENVFPVFLFE